VPVRIPEEAAYLCSAFERWRDELRAARRQDLVQSKKKFLTRGTGTAGGRKKFEKVGSQASMSESS
jgi:hypothetical protein